MNMNQGLGVHPLHESVELPNYATDEAACFDIRACLEHKDSVLAYSGYNRKESNSVRVDSDKSKSIIISPKQRVLVPTGIIFDVPEGQSLRLHMRSGIALKQGLMLANGEGVIDSDYVAETFVMLVNISESSIVIKDGERICQGELVTVKRSPIGFIDEAPTNDGNRTGGFGSTGKL